MEQIIYEQIIGKIRDVLTAFPSVKLYVPNQKINFATLVGTWVKVELEFDAINQASLGTAPVKRYVGDAAIGVYVPEGDGIYEQTQIKEALSAALTCKALGPVILGDANSFRPQKVVNWHGQGLLYEFTADLLPL